MSIAMGDVVLLHHPKDGGTLVRARIPEAQMAGEAVADFQLFHAQLRVALLGVADDKKPVGLLKLLQGLPDTGIADVAGVFLQVPVFRLHAPVHQGIPLLRLELSKQGIPQLRHHPAKQGPQGLGIGAEPV